MHFPYRARTRPPYRRTPIGLMPRLRGPANAPTPGQSPGASFCRPRRTGQLAKAIHLPQTAKQGMNKVHSARAAQRLYTITRMTLSNWAALATIVQTFTVVVSLIFIARQLSQSRRIAEATSYQSIVDSVNNFYSSLATDPKLAAIYRGGRKEPEKLAEHQQFQFFYMCVQWFVFFENLYLQYKRGLLPSQYWNAWHRALIDDLAEPGLMEHWKVEYMNYSQEFQEFVASIIGPPAT